LDSTPHTAPVLTLLPAPDAKKDQHSFDKTALCSEAPCTVKTDSRINDLPLEYYPLPFSQNLQYRCRTVGIVIPVELMDSF
jgi:hypothetical protein